MATRVRGQARIRVKVDPAARAEVRRNIERVGQAMTGKALNAIVGDVSRDAAWWVKANMRPRKRTRQAEIALGGKAKGYRDGQVQVGLVGPRSHHTINDPRFGKVVPTKYFHLVEGGRKPVEPKKAKVLAIKVLRLQSRRSHRKIPGGWQWKMKRAPKPSARSRRGGSAKPSKPARRKIILGVKNSWSKLWERAKKVGGAFLIFAPRAAAAPAFKVVEREQARFRRVASTRIARELSTRIWQQARNQTQSNIRRAANRLARSNP